MLIQPHDVDKWWRRAGLKYFGGRSSDILPCQEWRGGRPFANAGIGGYKFSPGSTYFGGYFGEGLLFKHHTALGTQVSYNFHTVSTRLDPSGRNPLCALGERDFDSRRRRPTAGVRLGSGKEQKPPKAGNQQQEAKLP